MGARLEEMWGGRGEDPGAGRPGAARTVPGSQWALIQTRRMNEWVSAAASALPGGLAAAPRGARSKEKWGAEEKAPRGPALTRAARPEAGRAGWTGAKHLPTPGTPVPGAPNPRHPRSRCPPSPAPVSPRPGGRARPRRQVRAAGQGDCGQRPSAHLLSGAHVVLAEQAGHALPEGVGGAAVAVLLGAAAAPRPLRARGQQREQQRQQEQQPGPGPGPARGARAHPGAGGMRGREEGGGGEGRTEGRGDDYSVQSVSLTFPSLRARRRVEGAGNNRRGGLSALFIVLFFPHRVGG